jgi:hypothetical protein
LAKLVSTKCPSCGAGLQVPPQANQVPCRYCGNVITIEHKKPPPHVHPFGAPGFAPSRTIYIDPQALARHSRANAYIVLAVVGLTIVLPLLIGVVPMACRSLKRSMKPFPASCGTNEEVTLSGDWEGSGSAFEKVAHNCKIRIKRSKIKAKSLFETDSFNVEVTLEDSTVETTDVLVKSGSNLKLRVVGGSLTSQANVVETSSGLVLTLENTRLDSKLATAVKSTSGTKLTATNAKLHGKKFALDTESGLDANLKGASELTSEGTALKTSSGLKLEMDGGKIDGGQSALVGTSGLNVIAHGVTFTAKEKAISASSSFHLEMTDGSITAQTEPALSLDSSPDLVLTNAKIQGTVAVESKSSAKIRATKKTKLTGTIGDGVVTTSSFDLTLNDAVVEAARAGLRCGTNAKVRMLQGARISGKKGGIAGDGNLELEGVGATIDGGAGAGIKPGYNGDIDFKQGVLKGIPAVEFDRKPRVFEVDGTRVDGEAKIPPR